MYKVIYPKYDTTIYEEHQFRNTGADQIIELVKKTEGTYIPDILQTESTYGGTTNSRILLYFDLSDLQSDISSGKITGPVTYYLRLIPTSAEEIPMEYTIYAHPISGSWINGTGFYNNNPEIRNGASWKYRSEYTNAIPWISSSLGPGITGSFVSNSGGGVWYSSSLYQSTQSFSNENPEINMNITNLVSAWLSGSINNNGIIIKHSTVAETDSSILGSIKYFGIQSHTIYLPRLEIYWQDYNLSGTGSFDEVEGDDYILLTRNLKDTYSDSEISRVDLHVRDRYPVKVYSTASNYSQIKRVPTSSYYSIIDYATDEEIIKFDEGTRVNCDSNGNYIKINATSLLPERYYKLIFKINHSDNITKLVDDGFYFKVRRI